MKNRKFELWDRVIIIKDSSSRNLKGQIGSVTEIDNISNEYYDFRVQIDGMDNTANWQTIETVELLDKK